MLKILISYDMQPGKERECQDYLVNKLAPGLAKLGFRISEVLYTMWGESPQILSGGVVENLEQAQKIFQSNSWEKLSDGMEALTENFKVRVVRPHSEN